MVVKRESKFEIKVKKDDRTHINYQYMLKTV